MYLLNLNIKINLVTCPGVWLCQKGQVMLKVNVFGNNKKTRKIVPRFPLNFYEKFSFQKFVTGNVGSLVETFENEEINIDLIQWMTNSKLGVVLAKFNQHLRNLFESCIVEKMITVSSDSDLLMCKTDCFPGIISPKIQTKLQLKIEYHETQLYSSVSPDCNSNCLSRQRRVCHSNTNLSYIRDRNSDCSICSLSKKFGNFQIDKPCLHPYCYWCDHANSPCRCYTCFKRHLVYH